MTKRTVTIRLSATKSGKPIAHYWGLAKRWLPMKVEDAKLKLAVGEAVTGNIKTIYVAA